MSGCDLKSLKSGTDIRGVASGCLGKEINLDKNVAYHAARAFVKWLSVKLDKKQLKIAVGNDSRITADILLGGFCKGARDSGCDIIYTGLSSTPSMFTLLKKSDMGCDASVMITASHLPCDRNGLKFFTCGGGLNGKDIDEIADIALKEDYIDGSGSYEERPFMDEYSCLLADFVRENCGNKTPLKGKKIIVDAGNGAGGFFADKVLTPLGADTRGSLFLEPDGMFPNHIPNPEDKAALASLKEAVIKNNADLGVIFDTDVDRAAVIDKYGKEINRNRLIALLCAILFKERTGTIVTDSVTSDGLTKFIEAKGGKHRRYMRGYRNVIDECIRLNNNGEYSPLAIETSGHAAFKENYYLDDGAYLITRILICLAKQDDISGLYAELEEPKEEAEIRLPFAAGCPFKEKGKEIFGALNKYAQQTGGVSLPKENFEGVRLCFDKENGDGWALIRMSLHEPILPVNIESMACGGVKTIADKLYGVIAQFGYLDCSKLRAIK